MKRAALMTLALLCVAPVRGADSPQFGGPNRDNRFPETGLLKEWPEGGPPLAWKLTGLGFGYGSVSVVDGTVYIAGTRGGKGILTAIGTDGKIKWQKDYGSEWKKGPFPGARTTPTVTGGFIYLMTGHGRAICLDAKDGEQKWAVDTLAKFKGKEPSYGISESVLVDGDNVICTPGGPDATVVALHKETGETVWQSKGLSDVPSYCSPVMIRRGKRRLIVTTTAKALVALSPKGEIVWRHPHGKGEQFGNSPVYDPGSGILCFSAAYGFGAVALRLSADGSEYEVAWSRKELDCEDGSIVLVDGYVYGSSFVGPWVCLDVKTGEPRYRVKSTMYKGAVIYADGMLYGYGRQGNVCLIEPTPKEHKIVSSFKLPKMKLARKPGQILGRDHLSHLVISGGKLYLRYHGTLMVYDVRKK